MYVVGGRGTRTTSILDPITRTWSRGQSVPNQFHHAQCVVYNNNIFVAASLTGGFPNDRSSTNLYVYNTRRNVWFMRPGLPEDRRRGSSASVLFDNKIYVVGGNTGNLADNYNAVGWFDYYDLVTREWVTGTLPDLPDARDNFGGAIVGGRLCVAGGRNGPVANSGTVRRRVYCFNFARNIWQRRASLPGQRSGAATSAICGDKMMLAGGVVPSPTTALDRVDIFDGTSWESGPALVQARQGSGLAVARCSGCGQIFISTGSSTQDEDALRLSSTEVFFPDGVDQTCARY